MSVSRTNLFTTGCLMLGLLFCIAGVVTVDWYKRSTECFKNRPPLGSFIITIDRSQLRLLIDQSQRFSDMYGFEFDVVYYTPTGEEFLIDMRRTDVEITVSNPSVANLGVFYVYIYNYDCIQPTVASDIDGLVDDLKNLLSEIPGATITKEK